VDHAALARVSVDNFLLAKVRLEGFKFRHL